MKDFRDSETWFEIEYSQRDANDWFSMAKPTFDTEESARIELSRYRDLGGAGVDYRLVRKTLITEVLP